LPVENKHKNKKPIAKAKFLKNPLPLFLTISSHFIYSEYDFNKQFHKLKNKNFIKLTNEEQLFLKNQIKEIQLNFSIIQNKEIIELDNEIANKIINFKNVKSPNDNLTEYIKNKILSSNNRQGISCRKLAASYESETGKHIGKSTVNNIIRHKLGFRYLRTCKKSNYLITQQGIFSSLCFIKIFVKCLIKGFDFIFIDESSIQSNNPHYRCWRKYHEQIFFGSNYKTKINLIFAISKNDIIYYDCIFFYVQKRPRPNLSTLPDRRIRTRPSRQVL
jgi:hypothetical protein